MSDSVQEHTIVQMNRGSEKGKFFCYRKEGVEYLHSDGVWKVGTGCYENGVQVSSGYFAKREDIERLLAAQ